MDKATKNRCPHCNEPVHAELLAGAADESRISFALTPSPGELFSARVLGKALSGMADLQAACAKPFHIPVETLVEGVDVGEDGSLVFRLLLVRFEKATERKARIKAARSARE